MYMVRVQVCVIYRCHTTGFFVEVSIQYTYVAIPRGKLATQTANDPCNVHYCIDGLK